MLDELLRGGGSLGGEQSGHIIFPEMSLAGDGMMTAIEVLRVVKETGRGLGELAQGMQRYPQVTINVKVARKPPLESVPELRDAIRALEGEIEGEGRLLVRYSGTENVLRIMIEGREEVAIRAQAEALAGVVRQHLG